MSMIEKNLSQKNFELSRTNPELLKRREKEQKLVPRDPHYFDAFKDLGVAIEQVYLSHPSEEFSLRVRAAYKPEGTKYTATLKDAGEVIDGNLDRMEVETEIDAETFTFYQSNPDYPRVRKIRTELADGLTIDFVEGLEAPLIEKETSEDPTGQQFVDAFQEGLIDKTGDSSVLNESIAHSLHEKETLLPKSESIDSLVDRIVTEAVTQYSLGHQQVVLGISGMSGSGKSTVAREVEKTLVEAFGESFQPLTLSSDDYHRGKKWLEATYGAPWTNWDDPRVYHTAELAEDLKKLANGETIRRKHFDFATEEVIYDEEVSTRPFVIVEGLFAGSPDLNPVRHLHFEVPGGVATSIGRDVRRLMLAGRANGSIGSPESRLRYQMEKAVPTYTAQERPRRNSFAAYTRPLAERAFLLDKLREL